MTIASYAIAAVLALAALAVKLARWRQHHAETRAELAEGRAAAAGAQLEADRTGAADAAAATTAGQEVTRATAPRFDDPADPIAAAQARTARGEAAARRVRDELAAARHDGRLR